tara:strand:- start:382 stop:972 length:591 start_codon:yes stop_codon:yes gene_type:complete
MKKLFLNIMFFCLLLCSCENEFDFSNSSVIGNCDDECNEWERCTNVSQDFFGFDWQCRPKLNLYTSHGNWDANITITDQSGNSYFYDLENLQSHTHELHYITIDYPINNLTYSHENGFFPNADSYGLTFNFTDSKTLEFNINDMVYDPHVESNVNYSGSGQLIHTGGSADAVIEFSCSYIFEGNNYTVTFSASRYN